MANLSFNLIYSTDRSYILSNSDLLDYYMYGIPTCNPINKTELPESVWNQQIINAQVFIENYLNIRFKKQIIKENRDFIRSEWVTWSFLKMSFPINEIFSFKGKLNEVTQVIYPVGWCTVQRSNFDVNGRNVHIVPNSSAGSQINNVYGGTILLSLIVGWNYIPNYFELQYCTGFDKVPEDLLNVVAKLATINLLFILEPFIVGGNQLFGLTGSSIGIDGLSQSISKMNGGTIFQQRIMSLWNDLKIELPILQNKYRGFEMISM